VFADFLRDVVNIEDDVDNEYYSGGAHGLSPSFVP